MEKRRGGNGGQKDFQKTEGEGPGCQLVPVGWRR